MKLDALKELANALGHMDLSLDPGASQVALQIAGGLDRFILDNTPADRYHQLGALAQDAIDAARYRKLRAAHLNLRSCFAIRDSNGVAPTLDGASFDAWVDALPS